MPAWALRVSRDIPWGKNKQRQCAWTEGIGTNTDNSAYYGGAWVTCIFELKKNPDYSKVPKNAFQIASI